MGFILGTSMGPRKMLANFCKGPDSKHCRLCGPYGLCLNYSTCCHCAKAAIDCTQINDHDYVPIKLHLQKQAVGLIWLIDHSLPISGLKSSSYLNDLNWYPLMQLLKL